MAVFKLSTGYRVRTTCVDHGMTFETTNPERETISTVTLFGEAAEKMLTDLRVLDALRFADIYGGGVSA